MEREQDFYKMTFSQREGKAPLPDQMQTGYISSKFRKLIWKCVHEEIVYNTSVLDDYYTSTKLDEKIALMDGDFDRLEILSIQNSPCGIEQIMSDYKFEVLEMGHEEISCVPSKDAEFLKRKILEGEYHDVLSLIEYMIQHEECEENFRNSLIKAFEMVPIAYSVVEFNKPTIVPRSSVKAGRAAQRAIEKLQKDDMDSAATHLNKARDLLKAQEYADSIRESIHAVESIACAIDPRPEAKNNLSKALNSLENNGLLKHADIKEACRKLYDFTNKVRGIRHAREARNPPDVGLEEAEFMLGACSFFADYLFSKHQQQQAEKQETEKQETDG